MDICNIMLLFLSDVKVKKDKDNELYIEESEYEGGIKVQTTNESAVKYLVNQKGISLAKLFVFETDRVRGNVTFEDKRNQTSEELLINGNTIKHNEFFRKRLDGIIQGILDNDGSYIASKYMEKGSVNDTMSAVASMSDKIINYVATLPASVKVVLHADATGGMRDANYAMLAVMRLMQYSGIEIGSVIYSDFGSKTIKELAPVYGLFDLIAGAEEFANFGSVNVIDRYFNEINNNSVEMKNLREAMKHFAEEIRLCHRKKLIDAAKNLGKSIEAFNTTVYNEENPIQEKLMRILSNRINKEYDGLFTDNLDDVCLIEWCLNHDYLQQALTLYVERVPQLLTVEKNILTINEEYIEDLKKQYYDETAGEEFAFWCLTNYCVDKELENTTESRCHKYAGNEYKNIILHAIDHMLTYEGNTDDAIEAAMNEINNYLSNEEYIVYTSHDKMRNMLKAIKKCYNSPELLLDDSKMPKEIFNMVNEYFSDDGKKRFYNAKFGKKRFKLLISRDTMSIDGYKRCFSNIRRKFSMRISLAVNAGIYTLSDDISMEKLDIILYDYNNIKTERNNSNHAKLNGKVIYDTADELKQDMLRSIRFIKKCLC